MADSKSLFIIATDLASGAASSNSSSAASASDAASSASTASASVASASASAASTSDAIPLRLWKTRIDYSAQTMWWRAFIAFINLQSESSNMPRNYMDSQVEEINAKMSSV